LERKEDNLNQKYDCKREKTDSNGGKGEKKGLEVSDAERKY